MKVAVSNAVDELKHLADVVTVKEAEDGVREFLKDFLEFKDSLTYN